MPRRNIVPELLSDEKICALSDFQFRVWVGLILTADAYGKIPYDAEKIKQTCFPRRQRITTECIDRALSDLLRVGLVVRDISLGEPPSLQFAKWTKYQRVPNKGGVDAAEKNGENATSGEALPKFDFEKIVIHDAEKENKENEKEKRIKEKDKEIKEYKEGTLTSAKEEPGGRCPFEKIKRLFCDTCVSFPKIRDITGKRRIMVSARWSAEPHIETFKELFEKAEASSFLKGENNRGWTASFDWLMYASNFSKVLEGMYDDKKSVRKKQKDVGFDIDEFLDLAIARSEEKGAIK